MNEPRWLSPAGVLAFHEEMLREHGGASGVRDGGMLESALSRPQNKWHYEEAGVLELAAAYAYGICQNHPFVDGNKRTAFVAMAVFLMKNGYRLTATEADAYKTMIGVASGDLSEGSLTEWLTSNVAER